MQFWKSIFLFANDTFYDLRNIIDSNFRQRESFTSSNSNPIYLEQNQHTKIENFNGASMKMLYK